jgi:hypothetical protein
MGDVSMLFGSYRQKHWRYELKSNAKEAQHFYMQAKKTTQRRGQTGNVSFCGDWTFGHTTSPVRQQR